MQGRKLGGHQAGHNKSVFFLFGGWHVGVGSRFGRNLVRSWHWLCSQCMQAWTPLNVAEVSVNGSREKATVLTYRKHHPNHGVRELISESPTAIPCRMHRISFDLRS